MDSPGNGGSRVAQLRKARDLTQEALARRAGVSVNLLSKIEVGDRALTPAVAASVARALRISLGALYGEAEVSQDQGVLLADLRTAVRRYDIPDQAPVPDPAELRVDLDQAILLREQADYAGVLRMLPGLLTRATTYAHAAASPAGWALLTAVAARDRAGTFLNCGDSAGGLTVVDRAIVAAEAELTGPEKAFATGMLHLRGMTLAGRLGDRAEAQRHISAAWSAAEEFPSDLRVHSQLFGPANTATHVLATEGDLGCPREVVRLAEQLFSTDTGLPPTRIGPTHISTARAHLDLGDRDSAQTSLVQAWDVAPQMAKTSPMGREVLRVLICLHRRSNPQLVQLAQRAGLTG